MPAGTDDFEFEVDSSLFGDIDGSSIASEAEEEPQQQGESSRQQVKLPEAKAPALWEKLQRELAERERQLSSPTPELPSRRRQITPISISSNSSSDLELSPKSNHTVEISSSQSAIEAIEVEVEVHESASESANESVGKTGTLWEEESSSEDDFPSITELSQRAHLQLLSQQALAESSRVAIQAPLATAPEPRRSGRERKHTSKVLSQQRQKHDLEEKRGKGEGKKAKAKHTAEVSQFEDMEIELPFRSSQSG